MSKIISGLIQKKDEGGTNMFLIYLLLSLLVEQIVVGGLMIAVVNGPDGSVDSMCLTPGRGSGE